ncbi:beta family protein [Klebsiella variicola]|uniref:beta family protein n=1 Tax=Klebsiella variicola TaxID=244366 RepID=UPI00277CC54B|nr:hypothetical protein [Klebsiella variicola]HBT4809753.1 hypothetical protein [Klebsiella variicola subsp. variicola]HDS5366313.1 hypothetical protein [Klebsiella variicola]HEO9079141.1 hypothetical protein [Klebsiella variicola]
MYNYIPFLKLKVSEIGALKELKDNKKKGLVPFFDFPRKKPKKSRYGTATLKDKKELFYNDLARLESKFNLNLTWINEFYLDNYDVEDGISIDGRYNYFNIIEKFSKFGMIPVISLDRSIEHMQAIKYGFVEKLFKQKRIAIRLTREYFSNYLLFEDELLDLINELKQYVGKFDIIFDCRVCKQGDSFLLAKKIVAFIEHLLKGNIPLGHVITTGSMIPASISELLTTQSELDIEREEIKVFVSVNEAFKLIKDISFGDYGAVSPEYSDIELFDEDMQNVTTAKVIYPYSNRIFVKRGGRVKGDKYQYNEFAEYIINTQDIYRGKDFSKGDLFLYQKANYEGKSVTAASIVKPLVNIHLSYMILER